MQTYKCIVRAEREKAWDMKAAGSADFVIIASLQDKEIIFT